MSGEFTREYQEIVQIGDVFSFMELVLFPENKNLSVIPNMSFFYNCRQIAYLSKAFPVFFSHFHLPIYVIGSLSS